MRIRKRQVPLPFSSLSPAPLSDPFIEGSLTVQLRQTTEPFPPKSPFLPDTATSGLFKPSDQTNQRRLLIGGGNNGCDGLYGASGTLKKEDNLRCSPREKENDGKEKRGRRVTRPEIGRCFEGEKAFPPKKRRGNMERRENEESSSMEDNKMKTKMKTKTKKNCDTTIRKRASGSALMAGSRCSRVNGRGWRCCQQTLVGYSLCEHHLGKGSLRGLTTQINRSIGGGTAPNSPEKEGKRTEDENKPLMTMKKKKTKLGMVKTLSLSSLLGQTNSILYSVDESREDDDQA